MCMKWLPALPLFCLALTGPGAAGAMDLAEYEGPGFAVVNPVVKTKLRRDAFADAIVRGDVIYAGEAPEQFKDHLAQLELLKLMTRARKGRVAVAFEMVDAAAQAALDEYAAGKITEAEFLERSRWAQEWGYDFKLYRRIFEFVRDNKLKALALNNPRSFWVKLARGGEAGLSPEEKAMLPLKVNVSSDAAYLAHLKRIYTASPASKAVSWENYLFSASAWNEIAAQRISAFLAKERGRALLVLAGNGRVAYNAGLPASLKARTKGLGHVSIYTKDGATMEDFLKEPVRLADYVWFISRD